MSVAEQRRFLRSWGNMIDKGIEGEYAKLVAMHSYSDPPSFACVHGRVHFAPWHRLYMLRMEKALQDSHEELYGNRSIALHFWDWGDSSKDHVFDPSLWSEQSSFGSVERMQGLFGGTRPLDQVALDGSGRLGRGSDRYNAQILYDDGYSPLPDSEMLADRRWVSIRSDYHAYLFRASRMRHDFAARLMEPFHNSVHLAGGFPMGPQDVSSHHINFFLHHSNIDRLWEYFLQERERVDGSRAVVEAEAMASRSQRRNTYYVELAPFLKADGSVWTSEGLYDDVSSLGYKYDKMPVSSGPAAVEPSTPTCTNDSSSCRGISDGECNDGGPGAVWADCELGTDCDDCGASDRAAVVRASQVHDASTGFEVSGGQTHVPVETPALIFFGQDEVGGCGLDHSQPSFSIHFFVMKSDEPELSPLPTYVDQLGNITQYVGAASVFAGLSDPLLAQMAANTTVMVEHSIPRLEGPTTDYYVMALYERSGFGAGELLPSPSFFHNTTACNGGTPVPDEDWFMLTSVEHYYR